MAERGTLKPVCRRAPSPAQPSGLRNRWGVVDRAFHLFGAHSVSRMIVHQRVGDGRTESGPRRHPRRAARAGAPREGHGAAGSALRIRGMARPRPRPRAASSSARHRDPRGSHEGRVEPRVETSTRRRLAGAEPVSPHPSGPPLDTFATNALITRREASPKHGRWSPSRDGLERAALRPCPGLSGRGLRSARGQTWLLRSARGQTWPLRSARGQTSPLAWPHGSRQASASP
jgi:hypothetical protein